MISNMAAQQIMARHRLQVREHEKEFCADKGCDNRRYAKFENNGFVGILPQQRQLGQIV
jgi:hypothetical protein